MVDDFWNEIRRMQKRFGRIFDPLDEFDESGQDYRRAWTYFRELENEFLIAVELPGVEKEDISLEVVEDRLVIKAEKKEEKEQKGKQNYSFARSYSGFARSVSLPENCDAERIDAEFKNGVLKVHVPKLKKEKKKGKVVSVR